MNEKEPACPFALEGTKNLAVAGDSGDRLSPSFKPEVLAQAIRDGVALLTWRMDTFSYAESFDEAAGRYRGLQGGQRVNVSADSPGLLVKPDVASKQLDATIEIEAKLPNGASDQLVRTVTENCRTLRFQSHGFEKE